MTTTQEIAAALQLGNSSGTRDERTLADMRDKHNRYGSLSAKQIAFALSLANKLRNPERHAIAPTGKAIAFDGKIQSVKVRNGFRNSISLKMTIKVETPDGTWIAWGTLPTSLYVCDVDGRPLPAWEHTDTQLATLRERMVRVKATLKRTDGPDSEPHFVIMTRPTASFIVEPDASDTVRMTVQPEMEHAV